MQIALRVFCSRTFGESFFVNLLSITCVELFSSSFHGVCSHPNSKNIGALDKKLRQPGHREVLPRSYPTGFEIFSISSLSLPFLRYYIIVYSRCLGHVYEEPETKRSKNVTWSQRDSLIKSAALSAMAYTAACVCPAGTYGKTDASTTLTPTAFLSFKSGSTTPQSASRADILAVLTG